MEKSNDFEKVYNVDPINSVKNVTRRILYLDSNEIKLSLVSLICIFAGVLVLVASSAIALPLEFEDSSILSLSMILLPLISFAALVAGTFFVFCPCIAGSMVFAERLVRGEAPRLGCVFSCFASFRSFWRSLLISFVLLVRSAIIFVPMVGGILNLPFFYSNIAELSVFEVVADSAFILALTFLALVVGAYISTFFFFVPYLMISCDMGFFASLSLSFRVASAKRKETLRETLSHTGSIMISALTLMVLWIFYTMPRMLVSYFVFCEKIFCDNNNCE